MGLNKREWLYNCIAMEVNKSHSLNRVYSFIEKALNPVAHTPKINWNVDEDKALDILTLISFAHKYLDECHKMLGKI